MDTWAACWYDERDANAEIRRLRVALTRAYRLLRDDEYGPQVAVAAARATLAIALAASPPPMPPAAPQAPRTLARVRLLPSEGRMSPPPDRRA